MMSAAESNHSIGFYFKDIYKKYGVSGFYKGLSATIGRASLNTGVKLSC